MKKTLLALSVLAAGTANAGVNLYDQDGVLVDLSAAAEVQYIQEIVNKDSNDDAGIRLDDGDLALNTTIAVNDQLNALGGIAFKFESKEVKNDELWVGLGGDFGTLTFGRQLLISDDSGIGKDIELGFEQISFGTTEGEETVKYVFDNGQFYFGFSHDLDAEGSKPADERFQKNDGTITDARLGARFADFDVRGYYYTSETASSVTPKVETDAFNLEAEYVMDAFAFAASYGQVEKKSGGVVENDIDAIEINGSYTLGKNTFALGYNRLDDSKKDNTVDNVYANVTHQLHSNVKAYAELGWADADKADYDLGYLVGMEVLF
ncbi:Porin-like protein H precursor [Photobacterium marinum]|uniref:Porin-like protein H n=1 Tax=Photobacterium marinum TaxID=1056511 RepID=L8JEQ7_9GAMM|nr:porin [Photobacterium marinum]ELR67300.1 Porin-like protein H precursor [Photobacterium marinum]